MENRRGSRDITTNVGHVVTFARKMKTLLLLLLACATARAVWKSLPHHEQHLKQLEKDRIARELAYYKEIEKKHKAHQLEVEKLPRDNVVTNDADKEALQALYKSTDGRHWNNNTGWKNAKSDPCTDGWYGIYCENGYVTYIQLAYNGLYGKLPAEINKLSKLNTLYLYSNDLSGSIPSELWGMKELQILDINTNELTGELPSEIDLPQLQVIFLYSNHLTGPLPSTWNTPKLTNLSLAQNEFTGRLPDDIGKLSSLEAILLSRNNLTGEYPASMGQLSKLSLMWLFSNSLRGPFPSSWSELTSLENVEIEQMTGRFPEFIGDLWRKLQLLIVARGELVGEIPSSMCNLRDLQVLWLFQNNLTGSIPSCITELTELVDIELSTNQLSGEIPSDIGNLRNLDRLYLSQNYLSGSPPSSLGNLVNAENIQLCQNALTGEVPSSLAALKGTLSELGFCYNKLSTFGSGLEDFIKYIGNYGCELYGNPWECPIPSYIPKDCGCSCSQCNSGAKHSSCSACVGDSDCGWCNEGPNCLEGDHSGPYSDYQCAQSDWTYGSDC